MGTPHIKHINEISLKFIEGDRNYPDVIHVLKNKIGLSKTDLVGVGFAGKDSVYVKFANNDIYNQVIKHHDRQHYDTDKGSIIQILDISTYKIKVFMKNVPFNLPNPVLRSILENHGVVESINTCSFPEAANEFLTGLQNMERVATMKTIHTPIPSTYYLNLTQSYIYFSYLNQQKTCTKCGSKTHLGRCPIFQSTVPWKRENVLNLSESQLNLPEEDFPPLQKQNPQNMPEATPDINDDTPETTLEKNLTNASEEAPPATNDATPETTQEKNLSNAKYDTQPPLDLSNQSKTHIDHLPPLEKNLSNGPKIEGNPFNAIKEKTNLEIIPEKNLSNSLPLETNTYNAENTKTNQEFILEKTHSKNPTLEISQKHDLNASSDPAHILEKNPSNDIMPEKDHMNAISVATDKFSILEKNPSKAIMPEKDHMNAISVATDKFPILEENLINDQKSNFSPPNLRTTISRKAHTYV